MNKEKELREEIKSILEALAVPGETVMDVHGANEFGLDLIVLKLDIFGKIRAYGIQVKTGDIKCSGKPTQKLEEIIGQLSIAFGKTVNVDGKEYKLDGFYVVTDGGLKGNTIEYIGSAFVGLRNLHFIDKHSLEEFRAKYKPVINKFRET